MWAPHGDWEACWRDASAKAGSASSLLLAEGSAVVQELRLAGEQAETVVCDAFAAFSAGKSGLRAVAQSKASKFGPLEIHVAHVVVDGSSNGDRIRLNRPQRFEEKGEDRLLS